MDYGFLSIIPPIIAIAIALTLKNAIFALFIALFSGYLIVNGFNPLLSFGEMLNGIIAVFSGRWAVVVIISLSLAFGISRTIEESGGARGLVEYLTKKRQIIKNKKQAAILTWLIGVILYSNATLSMILTGIITKPLNDQLKMSHEKQAFIIKTTGPPVCGLIPVGQWGGVLIGLMVASGIENTAEVLGKVVVLNFYCIIVVVSLFVLIVLNKDFFALKKAEERADQFGYLDDPKHNMISAGSEDITKDALGDKISSPAFVFVPVVSVLVITIGYMIISGGGNLLNGDAIGGLFWGMILSTLITILMNVLTKNYKLEDAMNIFLKGMGEAMPIMVIMTIAVALGAIVKVLGTGVFLASLFSGIMSPSLLPAILFVITCLIGYATGTATGNMAAMMPIAIPWAMSIDAHLPLAIAAVWGGAWFGDHVSPISDSTFMTCGIVRCDVYDHIKTLTPYGLIWAGASLICFLVAGLML